MDSRPLLQTYQQTQAIRLYYEFYLTWMSIDTICGWLPSGDACIQGTRVAAPLRSADMGKREPEFTHGEGLVMNFVSTTTGGGLHNIFLKISPPNRSTV